MSTIAGPSSRAEEPGRSGPLRVLFVVLGSLGALLALALVFAGGAIAFANTFERDDEGFFETPAERFATPTYALTHERFSAFDEARRGGTFDPGDLVTVRVRASSPTGGPIFVGIAPADDVRRFLTGVAHDEVDDVHYDPFSADYARAAGTRPAQAPTASTVWTTSAAGSGEQELVWRVESGTWSVVVMNADGSRGVDADVAFGAKVSYLG